MLALRDVTVRRHGRDGRPLLLLDAISWTVREGEHWAVLGPNGAGKSTLLALAGAVMQPTSGRVEVLGGRLGGTDVRTLRERIGQVDAVIARSMRPGVDGRTVVLTGAFGSIALQRRRLTPQHEQRAEELLRLVGAEALRDRRYDDCSQGERQRLLLARALMDSAGADGFVDAGGPDLLLLDEAAAGLDLPSRELLVAALEDSARRRPRMPTVTVTHHVEELPATTTHALLLRQGRTVAVGCADDVLQAGPLSACFGLGITAERQAGRWSARLDRNATTVL